jgi:hypothetical protein
MTLLRRIKKEYIGMKRIHLSDSDDDEDKHQLSTYNTFIDEDIIFEV